MSINDGSKVKFPTLVGMETRIKENAPRAIKHLERRDAMDLADMLGLTPHIRKG